ncbi:MAG: alpha/beta hydrolase family protein [Bacteroidota bacterium]
MNELNYSFRLRSVRFTLVLIMISASSLKGQEINYQTKGGEEMLPIFYEAMKARQTFPLSWSQSTHNDFTLWKKEARKKVIESLLQPPPVVPFNDRIIAEEDRGSYIVRKVVLNITGDSRVLALMTLPKSPGPHPAVLLLHDHGAKFDIGKEKVIEPFDVLDEKLVSAREWVRRSYGGRFIGDELAKQGYVCLALDMLNWSDRGAGGYQTQQALAANFFNMGASFAGVIAWEDMRAAEFLSAHPDVDPKQIVAMGLSVGGYRTWQLSALSNHITAGVSVCWMATRKGLMVPGNNQTGGHSAYTMLHPGIPYYLDYPDMASIACPKPMMFCNGGKDRLFPVESIGEAHAKMKEVWKSQDAEECLVTKIYDAPHEFNLEMQEDAFRWLNKIFQEDR